MLQEYELLPLKGYLVNCLEHFFLLFFCLQIMLPQLFALFQILFLLLSRAVEMLFFSLLCPQGANSTDFGKSPINNQSRRQGDSYLTTLINLVHSERYRHYLAPRLRRGAALRCQGSAWCIRYMQHVCNLPAWKRWRSSWHFALSDDCVTMT
jgi:hypothetical protein